MSPTTNDTLSPTDDHVQVLTIPGGVRGTIVTLENMKTKAREAARDPKFILWAQAIVRGVPSKDYEGEVQRIFRFVKARVRYRMDPRELEWVQDPYWTLCVRREGDCDDHAALIAGLCMAIGHGCAFKTIKADKGRPDDFSHVYALCGIRQKGRERWFAADTTQKESFLGWEPPEERTFGSATKLVAPP